MGWFALLLLATATFGAASLFGARGALRSLVAAAVMLGAAGYALQSKPTLPGRPTVAGTRPIDVPEGLVAFRTAILGDRRVGTLSAADAMLRTGDTTGAADKLIAAIRADPGSQALWLGLGSALVANDGGKLSPSAAFVFEHAVKLKPDAPGPWFFLGLAQAESGNFQASRALWRRALALTPANAEYRQDIALRMSMVERLLARQP